MHTFDIVSGAIAQEVFWWPYHKYEYCWPFGSLLCTWAFSHPLLIQSHKHNFHSHLFYLFIVSLTGTCTKVETIVICTLFLHFVITDVHITAWVLKNVCQFVSFREGTIVSMFIETIKWDLLITILGVFWLRSDVCGSSNLKSWTFCSLLCVHGSFTV